MIMVGAICSIYFQVFYVIVNPSMMSISDAYNNRPEFCLSQWTVSTSDAKAISHKFITNPVMMCDCAVSS